MKLLKSFLIIFIWQRTKRGEKWTPNDLYRVDTKGKVLVDDGIETSVLDDMRKISWE